MTEPKTSSHNFALNRAELVKLIAKVAINKHSAADVEAIKRFSNSDVELAIMHVAVNAPSWAITNINQANILGSGNN